MAELEKLKQTISRRRSSGSKLDEEQVEFIPGEQRDPVVVHPSELSLARDAEAKTPGKIDASLKNNETEPAISAGRPAIISGAELSMSKEKLSSIADEPGGQNFGKRPAVALTHLPRRPPVDIVFDNLSYIVPEGKKGQKVIIRGLQGNFRNGRLTAIMGPSGAGKSTLMNILAGYKTSHVTGEVQVNGKERNLRRFRKMSCYIMQDTQLLPNLTVYESMMVAAELKLKKNLSVQFKRNLVEEIIETLGLKVVRDTQTQCLSGGQRKRLSIGFELVNNPPVMFFDEPTSGLDSSSCLQCINLLKSLSRGGRTIICTIHQPSARLFEAFDHLYILAEGQCMYQGSVFGLLPFLSSMNFYCPSYHNPADFVMEIASGEHGDCIEQLVMAVNKKECAKYQTTSELMFATNDIAKDDLQTPQSQTKTEETSTGTKTPSGNTVIAVPVSCTTSLLDSDDSLESSVIFSQSTWVQFRILLIRIFLSQMRDMTLTRIRLVSHFLVGFILGIVFYDIGNDANNAMSNAGCLFFTVMFVMFTGLMPTIMTFPAEMSIFVREHLNYWYSLKAYYLAKTFADLPFQVAYSAAFLAIVYYMSGQPREWYRFLLYLNICTLTSLVAQSIGLLIGAAMNIENGMYVGPTSTIPSILFAGHFTRFSTIPVYLKFFSYISYIRYGFEGTIISIYGYNREKLICSKDFCYLKYPKKLIMELEMENAVYWVDAAALIAFLVILRIAVYFTLKIKLKSLR